MPVTGGIPFLFGLCQTVAMTGRGKFDLSALEKALASLRLAAERPKDDFIRDSVIQRFEYTYELCWKFLARFLEHDLGSEEVDKLSRKDLFRTASEKGYLDNCEEWFIFHTSRNLSSHTYQESTAEAVYEVALKFIPEAENLLAVLRDRNVGIY